MIIRVCLLDKKHGGTMNAFVSPGQVQGGYHNQPDADSGDHIIQNIQARTRPRFMDNEVMEVVHNYIFLMSSIFHIQVHNIKSELESLKA